MGQGWYLGRVDAPAPGETPIPCRDLDAAVASLTDLLGFRLESVFPADAPRMATMSGHGLRLLLDASAARPARPVMPPAPVELSPPGGAAAFDRGRAGMGYRDLLPSRFGGALIASHIQIPEGGPVPDYVHWHDIQFQAICCVRGWVEVVYEDQGPAFIMREGDCVLQPPGIRHRVLRCSDMMEVIEVGGPAEHVTHVDHQLGLPTAVIDPGRDFGGQRFVRHRASETPWISAETLGLPGFEQRTAGLLEASRGRLEATTLRATADGDPRPLFVELTDEASLYFVLSGELRIDVPESDGTGNERNRAYPLRRGDAITVAPAVRHGLSLAEGSVELLRITARLR